MKKRLRRVIPIVSAAALMLVAVPTGSAEAIYVVNGYSYTIIDNQSISLCGWDNRTPELIVPDSIADRVVTQISFGAFQDNHQISSVDFSQAKHLQTIRGYAFSPCNGIEGRLDLSGSFSTVESCAFEGCDSLESVYVGDNLTAVPNQCFHACAALSEAEIAEGVQQINAFSFADCPQLTKVVIPDSVSFISGYAFNGSPEVTVYCTLNSYAQQYAVKKNIPYVLTGGVMLGDVNTDGSINVNDVTALQRCVAELEMPEAIGYQAADIDGNGSVDISDATELQRFLAEYATEYPIGQLITL